MKHPVSPALLALRERAAEESTITILRAVIAEGRRCPDPEGALYWVEKLDLHPQPASFFSDALVRLAAQGKVRAWVYRHNFRVVELIGVGTTERLPDKHKPYRILGPAGWENIVKPMPAMERRRA